ncbi:MAG: Outer rane lipoprotein omp16 precursor [Labilithrix sp.]|nr:Outer rane lipoprotein omp16 precursor [Labilithrix sp.]
MSTRTRTLLGALVVATSVCSAVPSNAQATGFALSRFEPSERGSEWFALESLDLRGHGRWNAGIVAEGAYRPLAIYDANGDIRSSVVRNQIFAHPGANVVLWERLRLGVSIPIVVYQDGHDGTIRGVEYRAPDTPAFGDVRLAADVRLLGVYGGPATLAAGVQVQLPTGSRDDFTSDGSVRFQPRLLAAGDVGPLAWAAKLGFQYRNRDERIDESPLGSELTFAGALGIRAAHGALVVGPEVFGSTIVSDGDAFFQLRGTPLDAILGVHYTFAEQWRVGGGGGAGLTRGFGSPEARYMVSIERVAPFEAAKRAPADRDGDGIVDTEDACADVPGVRTSDPKTNGCPPDKDGDGVVDAEDACIDVPGVRTTDSKTNGCPPDKDGDGVLDAVDACIDVPGVKTSDPKTNGCPPDKDGDGVLDAEDACVDVPGVKTSDPKTNGCPPDPDRDKDGVPNAEDACPDIPGKPSPDPAKNGCPLAFVQAGQIKILEQVKFVTGSAAIQPGKDSENVLQAVLKVLQEHPEIKRLRVEGHTDDVGKPDANKKLSKNRAESVVAWLTKRGVEKARLTPAGFGMERPIADNKTVDGRRDNRRVEFHIESE